MFFRKSEPRGTHPCLIIAVGILAMVGAVAIVNESRSMMTRAKDKMMTLFNKCKSEDCCEDM